MQLLWIGNSSKKGREQTVVTVTLHSLLQLLKTRLGDRMQVFCGCVYVML